MNDNLVENYLGAPLDEPVDVRRNQFHINFIPPELITEKLNAQGYRPEILLAKEDLQSRHCCDSLEKLCSEPIRQGITPSYGADGPPCLKLKDVHHISVDSNTKDTVSEAFANEYSSSIIQRETVLINRSGAFSVGRTGAFLRKQKVFASDDLFKCVPSEKSDAGFIAVFLSSWWGKRSIESGITGSTGQLKLSQEHIRHLPIPRLTIELQRAVGNIIRKAERLRELADASALEFRKWIDKATGASDLTIAELNLLNHIPSKTCSDSVWITDFDPADRVDPWPFHLAARTIVNQLKSKQTTKRFPDLFSVETPLREKFHPPKGTGCFYLSILDVDSEGTIDWEKAEVTRYGSPGTRIVQGDILYPTLNPQETRVAYISTKTPKSIAASTEFAALVIREEFHELPYLLAAVLRSPWVRVQASFLTRSSSLSRRRLAERDLAKLLIPWEDDGASTLDSLLKTASSGYEQAGILIDEAERRMEELIIGNCDQEALLKRSASIDQWLIETPSPNLTPND